mgnify:CR=1 FL=1|jgi:hypothetical protein
MIRKLGLRHIDDIHKVAYADTSLLSQLVHDLKSLLIRKGFELGFVLAKIPVLRNCRMNGKWF